MVKVREGMPLQDDGAIDIKAWLAQLNTRGYTQDLSLVRSACGLSQLTGTDHATETGEPCLNQGLAMADLLASLEVDQETLAAAILFESAHYAELSLGDIAEQVSPKVAELVRGVEKMSAISTLQTFGKYPQHRHQMDNIRKMLLAMVDDVRVVLIKLAERLCVLRFSAHLPQKFREQIAEETMEIYAPLANRLGLGAIKWEMEDLAFRYLHLEAYKAIAQGLKAKRLERDHYVSQVVDTLNQQLKEMRISHFTVSGRSKHIHSIYRKMTRKNIPLDQIYDATAVRILVDKEEDCYAILSVVHSLWEQIRTEFDDYIAHPKPNGYQSLHTAVLGPEGRVFEVQIRTFAMHAQAEKGVAAHWRYKEGKTASPKASHERKIEWLREVLAWHREMAEQKGIHEATETEFLEERVYVFSPAGEVFDLPKGVTPLDFAYHVHSDVGHRCRGAKVNGHIVPLTYTLHMGDRIEILTGKEVKPSRDWANPHLHYLHTSRAKAKVLHWFKLQEHDKHKELGQEILEKELKSAGLKLDRLTEILPFFHLKRLDDLFVAVAHGDIKSGQVLNRLAPPTVASIHALPVVSKSVEKKPSRKNEVQIEGVNRLLTHAAQCCQPVPGEDVIGYITLGRGVSIHRKDCINVIRASERDKERFLQASWGTSTQEHAVVDILIKALDHPSILRELTTLLAQEKIPLIAVQTQTNQQESMVNITLSIEIDSLDSLSKLMIRCKQIPNVLEARRQV